MALQWVNASDCLDCVIHSTDESITFPNPLNLSKNYPFMQELRLTIKTDYITKFFSTTRVRFTIDDLHGAGTVRIKFGIGSPQFYMAEWSGTSPVLIDVFPFPDMSNTRFYIDFDYGDPSSEPVVFTMEFEIDVVTQKWQDYQNSIEVSD